MQTTHSSRIEAIQKYAGKHGYALALPLRHGAGTTGFNDCTPESQAWQLDKAANYLLEITE